MNSVPIATFNELEPAQQLQKNLLQAGIPAVIRDESKVERYWFMSEPLAAIHVDVPPAAFERSQRLLHEWETSHGELREALYCPECSSSRIEYPQITRRFLTPILCLAAMAVRLIPREYYCMDCHFTWPKEERVDPDRDVLGWPMNSKSWHPEQTGGARTTSRWTAARILLGPPRPRS